MEKKHEQFLNKILERRRFGIKPGLETISRLAEKMGSPEKNLKFVHIAGTNGKGATCALVDSALREAGISTGRFTSPHLVSINERFFVNGNPVSDELLASTINETIPIIEEFEKESRSETTFFECLTLVALCLFAKANVQVVVFETGLGGRFDATNIIPPENLLCCAITRIGLDHCDYLGNTIPEIAAEKGGIVKRDSTLVLGKMPKEAKDVILEIAESKNAVFKDASKEKLPDEDIGLWGSFQKENAKTALSILNVLKEFGFSIPDDAIKSGFKNVIWPGRCQRIEKDGANFIVDGAHNPDAANALLGALEAIDSQVGLIAGFCGDKDVDGHLAIMAKRAVKAWAVKTRNERSLDAQKVSQMMRNAGIEDVSISNSLSDALTAAGEWSKKNRTTVVVCGSLFLAGEALQELNAFPWNTDRVDDNESVSK